MTNNNSETVDDFVNLASPYIDSNAFDVTQFLPFVASYKTPNSYATKGYMDCKTFLALEFAKELATELGDNWRYDPEDSCFSEFARIHKGQFVICIRTQGYGVNAYSKLELTGFYVSKFDNKSTKGIEIKVSMSKDIATIANDVKRRILPTIENDAATTIARDNETRAAQLAIETKAAQIARKYTNLKVKADSARIYISTKIGAGISIDAYIYKSNDIWRLTSKGYGLQIDNIDSKFARALLRIVNRN